MLEEFLRLNIWMFFLVVARVGTAISMLPGFAAVYVPVRMRLVFGLGVSFLLMPAVSQYLPPLPASAAMLVLIVVGEVLVGAFMATIARALFSALQAAGTFISYFASMANAMIQDPIAEQQSSIVAGFLSTMGILLMFVTNMHHLILRALADSYTLFTPGAAPMLGDMSNLVTRHVADAFALGLQLSAPFLLVALVYYIGLGILGRLMPTLQVFFFGMPFQISAQFWVLTVTVSGIMMVFLERFGAAYAPFLAP